MSATVGATAQSAVGGLKKRVAAMLAFKVLLVLVIAAGASVLATILADAIVILPVSVRFLAPWCLVLGACASAAYGAARVVRLGDFEVARRFEDTYPELGNVMTNAVQLTSPPPQARRTAVEAVLRSQAVERGRSAASGVAAWPVERRAVSVLAGTLAATTVVWILMWTRWGGLFEAVLPRFLDPFGDHPPYSRLKFELEPGCAEIPYGGQLEVRVRTAGRPVEKLFLVSRRTERRAGGDAEMKTIMFVSPNGSYFQTMANLREPTEYFVTDGRARSHRFKVDIKYTPRMTLAECKIEYPEYMNRKAKTTRLLKPASLDAPATQDDSDSSEAQAGERAVPLDAYVSLRIASNRPLSGGQMVLTPVLGGSRVVVELAPELAPDGESASVVSGGFLFTEPVAFSATVTDREGLVSTKRLCGRFAVDPDERPRLWVSEPGKNAVATPDVSIPVRVRAEDDHAVAKIIWFRSHNQSVERPHDMALKENVRRAPRAAEAESSFDMASLGVRPGDTIEYYFEAVDNYPRGPNIATSRIFKIEVISVEQYKELLRRMTARRALFESYSQLGDWLRRLSERGAELAKSAKAETPDTDAVKKEGKRLAEDLAEYNKELSKFLAQPDLFDLDPLLKAELQKQRRQLQRLASEMGSGSMAAIDAAAEALAELSRYERQNVGEPVRHVQSVVDVMSKAGIFARLTVEQRRIVRLAERFKDARAELSRLERMELQDLTHAEERVHDAVEKLVAELPSLIDLLPDDPEYDQLRSTSFTFVEAVGHAGIIRELAGASDRFAALDGPGAYPRAAKALKEMEKLVAKNPAGGGSPSFAAVFQPAIASAMSSSLQQILSAMGAGAGSGGGGAGGYGMYPEDVALYGPSMVMGGAGELGGAGSSGSGAGKDSLGTGAVSDASDAADPALERARVTSDARLEPQARFPLRYRTLVGEYFRAIAESLDEEE